MSSVFECAWLTKSRIPLMVKNCNGLKESEQWDDNWLAIGNSEDMLNCIK